MTYSQLKFLLISAGIVGAFACSGTPDSGDTQGKGAEDDELVDGKADSFFRPTKHGQLVFDDDNDATISAASRYNAWEFSLGEGAGILLRTYAERNLDTVMYLYRRDVGVTTGSWGRYIAKNDDADSNTLDAKLDFDIGELQAGNYRVIVKAHKRAMYGSFSLTASCEGNGCRPGSGSTYDIDGTVVDGFIGEIDPYVFGDACVLTIKMGDQQIGVVEEFDADETCPHTIAVINEPGTNLKIAKEDLETVSSDEIDILNRYDQLNDWFRLTGDIEVIGSV